MAVDFEKETQDKITQLKALVLKDPNGFADDWRREGRDILRQRGFDVERIEKELQLPTPQETFLEKLGKISNPAITLSGKFIPFCQTNRYSGLCGLQS